MKIITPILILAICVTALCVWDGIYTNKVFSTLNEQSKEIYSAIDNNDLDYEDLSVKIENISEYWTNKMNILIISISRKDLQPVSDYIQYLASAIKNENAEDCLTYSRLLDYNITGLSESYGISFTNLL